MREEWQKYIDKAEDIIKAYAHGKNTQDIDALLTYQDQLAALNYFIGEILAELKMDYKNLEHSHDVAIEETKLKYVDKGVGIGITEAGSRSRKENASLGKQSVLARVVFFRLEGKERHIRGILGAMSQRISYLKEEKNRTEYQRN